MTSKNGLALISLLPSLLVLDRVLKAAAVAGARFGIWKTSLVFELFRNTGIAFSLPISGPIVWLSSAAILAGVCALAVRDVRARRVDRMGAYILFVLGASSNLFDRIAYGFTIDYLIFFSRSAVNVADGMIVAGAIWLIARSSDAAA